MAEGPSRRALGGLVGVSALPGPLAAAVPPAPGSVIPGIEVLLSDLPPQVAGRRTGLLTNPTGVDRALRSTVDRMASHPGLTLVALFGPEHGVRGDAQAGQRVSSGTDRLTGLPVHSLYGDHREPTPDMLAGIDALVIDLQDIGSRYYTYAWTALLAARAAIAAGLDVVVADRPNPLGGVTVEGPGLEAGFSSLVGGGNVPVRHGLTLGEMLRLALREDGKDSKLTVVRCRGWARPAMAGATALPWVMPSPNMPTPETALVYPGTCLLEGTNLSEGRGTTRPFEIVGAPFIVAEVLAAHMNARGLDGVRFRPVWFTPTFSKHAGTLCGGVQVHVTDARTFAPFQTGLTLLHACLTLYGDQVTFTGGSRPFFDLLAGNAWLRDGLLAGAPVADLMAQARQSQGDFASRRSGALLY